MRGARKKQHARDCQRGDRSHDQMHRRFQPHDRREQLHQQIHAEIGQKAPFEAIPLRQYRRAPGIELHRIARDMAAQINERQHRCEHGWNGRHRAEKHDKRQF